MKAQTIRKNIIALLIVMATVLLLPLVVLGADDVLPISIEVNYGFENNAKGGRYLPLNIKYHNTSDIDFAGNISIYSRESDDKICEYRNEIALAKDTSMGVTYYIPLGIKATSLHIKIRDNQDQEIIDRDINLGIDANNAQLFIGVLSDTPESLKYFDNVSLHYGLLRSRSFTLDTESFPRQSIGLDMLDMIIITNYTIRDLDEAQSHALMEWVRQGGVLLLGTGERVDDTLGRYAPELLDDMYEAPEICSVNLTTGPGIDNPDSEALELYCTEVAINGGTVIMRDGSLPLLTATNKENGLIVVGAYDFADVAEYAETHKSYAVDVLTASLGESRMDALASEVYGTDNSRFKNIAELTGTGDTTRIPPIGIYALSIVAFILLAGPGMYLFLKQRGLSAFYRAGVVLLSICFTLLIYLVGGRTRFDNTFYNFATIIETDEETIKETTYLNLRNPYNTQYSVGVGADYTIYPVRDNVAVSRVSEDWSDPIDVSTLIARGSEGVKITVGEVGAFTPQYFSLEKSSDNENGNGFTGDVTIYGNEIGGYLTNEFDFEVQNVSMIFYGKIVSVGNMAPFEIVQLDDLKVVNVPLNSSREVAALLVDDQEKINTVAFYRDMYMNGYTDAVHIVGFKREDKAVADALVTDADLNGRGLSMMAGTMTAYSYSEDRLYQSVMVKSPTVISGEYDYKLNTMTVGEPCVLEYSIADNMQLINLVVEWADPDSFSKLFTGTVSLYNYSTGSYDKLDTSKTVYDMESISPYLSPSNSFTVRYSYQGDVEAGKEVALPMISVVGTENAQVE